MKRTTRLHCRHERVRVQLTVFITRGTVGERRENEAKEETQEEEAYGTRVKIVRRMASDVRHLGREEEMKEGRGGGRDNERSAEMLTGAVSLRFSVPTSHSQPLSRLPRRCTALRCAALTFDLRSTNLEDGQAHAIQHLVTCIIISHPPAGRDDRNTDQERAVRAIPSCR